MVEAVKTLSAEGGEAPQATGDRGGMNSTGADSAPDNARPASLPPSRPPFPARHPPDRPATANDLTPQALVADTHPEQTTFGDPVAAHDVFDGVLRAVQHPPVHGEDNRNLRSAGGHCANNLEKAQARDNDGGDKRQTGEAVASIADREGPFSAEGLLLSRSSQLLRPGANERKLVSENQDPATDGVSRRERPAEETEEDSWTVQRQDERQGKKVRFMTDGSLTKPSEQHGDIRSQPMDSEKHDTTASSVTAGSGSAVGTATLQKQQQLPDPVTAGEDQGKTPKDPATQSSDAFPGSSVSQQNSTHAADATPSMLTQDTSASLHAMVSPAKDGDGMRDPFSLIGREDVQLQRPHPSQHLLSLYGLSPLAASVARFDPITGEKINRLRKSYEGQIAKLGLSGRNKSVKHEFDPEHKRLGLEELVRYPLEEWRIQHETKNPLAKGWNASGSWEISGAFKEKLERAFTFDTTPVPKSINADWEYHLGHEKTRVKTKPATGAATPVNGPTKVNGVQQGSSVAIGTSVRTNTSVNAGNEAARPRRAGKKRRYNDDSFEGYGEGFVDDDVGSDGGDSSNEGSRSSKKKRRKDSTAGTMPPRPQGRMGSYGPGMIHQTGIGAFGR